MLELQKFLQTNSTEELEKRYKISATRSKKYPNLVLFYYNQLESNFSLKIVRESRGIILDESQNWEVVSRSFDKFFNYQELLADILDLDTTAIQEKLDGSMICMWWYGDKWNISTSGSPDASGNVGDRNDLTFEQHFWNTWNLLNYELPNFSLGYMDKCNPKDYTFIFELCTLENRVVVVHETPRIVLIGCRHVKSGLEYNAFLASNKEWEIVQYFTAAEETNPIYFASDMSKELEGIKNEGYVCVDRNFKRVKIKSEDYLRLHRMKAGHSIRSLIELIQKNEGSEFLSYFPEYKNDYEKYKTKYDKLIKQVDIAFNDLRDKFDLDLKIEEGKKIKRKEIALYIQAKYENIKSYLFLMLDSNKSALEVISSERSDTLKSRFGG